MKPLCPHCYRDACPWLGAWRAAHSDGPGTWKEPTRTDCPLADDPLVMSVRFRLIKRLGLS